VSSPSETYVYGVLSGAPRIPDGTEGVGDPGAPVRLVRGGPLSALVSDVEPGPHRATRRDLARHLEVLQEVGSEVTLVPLRFGTIMPSDDAVRDELLVARRPALERLLERLGGRVELNLKGTYDEQVFAEIVAEHREIADLRRRVEEIPATAAYYDRIRLGELVAGALAARRERDAAAIVERLAPLAEDVSEGALTHERGVVNAAFLVDRERIDEFDAAANAVAGDYDGRIAFRYTGPLPGYSFTSLEEEPAWA
jgi:hypothetical protein